LNAAAIQLLAAYTSMNNTALMGFTTIYPVKYGGYKIVTIADSALCHIKPCRFTTQQRDCIVCIECHLD